MSAAFWVSILSKLAGGTSFIPLLSRRRNFFANLIPGAVAGGGGEGEVGREKADRQGARRAVRHLVSLSA